MRNMHGWKAMKTWTSDSAAKHIPILKKRRQRESGRKKYVFQRSLGLCQFGKQSCRDLPRQWIMYSQESECNQLSFYFFFILFQLLAPLLGWLEAYQHTFYEAGFNVDPGFRPPIFNNKYGRLPLASHRTLCDSSTLLSSSYMAFPRAYFDFITTCLMP